MGPVYGKPYLPQFRALIATWYVTDTCEGTWLQDQLDILKDEGWSIADPWVDSLTTADLDAFYMDSAWQGNPSLLQMINASLLQQVSWVPASLVMGFNPMPVGVDFVTQRAAIVLSAAVPPSFPGSLDALDPSNVGAQYVSVVNTLDPTVPQICVFDNPLDDPQLQYVYTSACTQVTRLRGQVNDTLTVCPDGSVCTQAPILYSQGLEDNRFFCQYYPTVAGYACDDSTPGCGAALLQHLYSTVTANYAPEEGVQLPPQTLPWFEAAWLPSFSLAPVLDYLANIMPNTEQKVMCTLSNNGVNLTNCSNPHYQRLKSHVTSQFKHNASVIVPAGAQLDWPVDAAFLASGAVFAYSSTSRNVSNTYLDGLFTDSSVCTDAAPNQRICWKGSTATQYSAITPWTLGFWNPFSECDVTFAGQTQSPVEYIDAGCSAAVCGSSGGSYAGNMPFYSACSKAYGQTVPKPGVPQIDVLGEFLPYNLCLRPPVEDSGGCANDQSLLGGFDGLPVASGPSSVNMAANTPYAGLTYTVSTDMYTPSEWQIPEDFYGGLFSQTNPLLSGDHAPFGFLRIPPNELGVHRIGLQISRDSVNASFSMFEVYKLPLGSDSDGGYLDAIASLPVSEWVPGLLGNITADSSANLLRDNYYRGFVWSDFTCPLRWFAFYSSSRPAFAPTMPSPQRAFHVFSNITRGAYAHPTMTQVTDGRFLGQYASVNGFCFCPVVTGIPQYHCQVLIGADYNQPCSLASTAESVAGGPAQTVVVYQPFTLAQQARTCTMSLDWPNLDNPLRDGSAGGTVDLTQASDATTGTCHVLDRLQPFRFKYVSAGGFEASGQSLNGACQTRRVAQLPATLPTGRCVRDSIAQTTAQIRCAGAAGTTPIQRPVPLTPPQTYTKATQTARARCGRCSPPPRFTTTAGAPMSPPESSFGRPFRLSAERAMARDLLAAVCSGPSGCPPLNRSAWARGQFMRNFLTSPARLFAAPNGTVLPPRNVTNMDDSPKWERDGWVYCPDRASLVSGVGCQGTIPRAEWVAHKTTICPLMIKGLSSNGSSDGFAQTPLYSIDSYTAAVSTAFVEAQRLIAQANCIAAGNFTCLPAPWVYHPASYDPSNQEWVYESVLAYYRTISATACPLTKDEQNLQAFNAQFEKNCPANLVRFLVDLVAILRLVGTTIIFIVSTGLSMLVELVTLLFAGVTNSVADAVTGGSPKAAAGDLLSAVKTAMGQLASDWAYMKSEGKGMLAGINSILMDMVFTTGEIGKGLLAFLTSTCGAINDYYSWFLNVWCNFVQKYLSKFLVTIRGALSMIASGFEILQDFMDEVFQGILPAAFMAKYGNKLFQKTLIEKYSQPSVDKKTYYTKVEKEGRVFFKAEDKAVSEADKGGRLLGVLGKASAVLSFGLAVYDAFNDIQGAINYPDNFTLFDFSSAFDGIDEMLLFITNDNTCLVYEIAHKFGYQTQLFSCFSSTLAKNPALANLAETSIEPSLCWASAQDSLGESSLFSCHSGSTCCPDNGCATPIVCAQVRFGCDARVSRGTDPPRAAVPRADLRRRGSVRLQHPYAAVPVRGGHPDAHAVHEQRAVRRVQPVHARVSGLGHVVRHAAMRPVPDAQCVLHGGLRRLAWPVHLLSGQPDAAGSLLGRVGRGHAHRRQRPVRLHAGHAGRRQQLAVLDRRPRDGVVRPRDAGRLQHRVGDVHHQRAPGGRHRPAGFAPPPAVGRGECHGGATQRHRVRLREALRAHQRHRDRGGPPFGRLGGRRGAVPRPRAELPARRGALRPGAARGVGVRLLAARRGARCLAVQHFGTRYLPRVRRRPGGGPRAARHPWVARFTALVPAVRRALPPLDAPFKGGLDRPGQLGGAARLGVAVGGRSRGPRRRGGAPRRRRRRPRARPLGVWAAQRVGAAGSPPPTAPPRAPSPGPKPRRQHEPPHDPLDPHGHRVGPADVGHRRGLRRRDRQRAGPGGAGLGAGPLRVAAQLPIPFGRVPARLADGAHRQGGPERRGPLLRQLEPPDAADRPLAARGAALGQLERLGVGPPPPARLVQLAHGRLQLALRHDAGHGPAGRGHLLLGQPGVDLPLAGVAGHDL